jgi:hypothetical protein
MHKILNIKGIALFAITLSIVFAGCKEKEEALIAPRLFSPVVTTDTLSVDTLTGKCIAKVFWPKLTGDSIFEMALSTDTFKTVISQNFRTNYPNVIMNLDCSTAYQLRIRAIGSVILASTNDTIRSYYNNFYFTTPDFPTELNSVINITGISARIPWKIPAHWIYTRLDLVANKTVVKSIPLTSTDLTAGYKDITGLQGGTTYIAKIYNVNGYRGQKTFMATDLKSAASITGTSAKISWVLPSSYTYTRIDVLANNAIVKSVTLQSTDLTNGYINLSGLTVSTLYTVIINDANGNKGQITFTTTAS